MFRLLAKKEFAWTKLDFFENVLCIYHVVSVAEYLVEI